MKSLFVFYLEIILPIILILYLFKINFSVLAVICLFVYALLYRPLVDHQRLKTKGIISESFWKLHIPLFRIKYFKALYTNP
jgi:hypothetical protein